MGLNSRKSGQPALGRAASRSQGAACVCVGLASSPAPSSCVCGGACVAARVQRAPALPLQACPCVSSLSWVCLGWAGEERPLLLCWVGADGEESPPLMGRRAPPLPSLLQHGKVACPGGLAANPSLAEGRCACCSAAAVRPSPLWDSAELLPSRCL